MILRVNTKNEISTVYDSQCVWKEQDEDVVRLKIRIYTIVGIGLIIIGLVLIMTYTSYSIPGLVGAILAFYGVLILFNLIFRWVHMWKRFRKNDEHREV